MSLTVNQDYGGSNPSPGANNFRSNPKGSRNNTDASVPEMEVVYAPSDWSTVRPSKPDVPGSNPGGGARRTI